MTVGEAMWSPRFLQYAAEIAPEGRTGEYMGVAQLPWFLTKMIVPIYSGWFLLHYCPEPGKGPEPERHHVAHLRVRRHDVHGPAHPRQGLARQGFQDEAFVKVNT